MQLLPNASDYGMPVPAGWSAPTEADPALARAFAALTPRRQRRIPYVVGEPKGAATRVRKAEAAAAYLREVGAEGFDYAGLVDFTKGK